MVYGQTIFLSQIVWFVVKKINQSFYNKKTIMPNLNNSLEGSYWGRDDVSKIIRKPMALPIIIMSNLPSRNCQWCLGIKTNVQPGFAQVANGVDE